MTVYQGTKEKTNSASAAYTPPAGRLKSTGSDMTLSRMPASPGPSRAGKPGKSTKPDGWTEESLRRFKDFVRSIDPNDFSRGHVSAITLTTGKLPSSDLFKKMIAAVTKELDEMTGGKWVYCIEKTKNQKAPHVHLLAVFPAECGDLDAKKVIAAWFKRALKFGLVPSLENQDARDAWSPEGWMRYMTKRDSKLIMHGLKELSVTKGCLPCVRMWGHGNGWTLLREYIDLTDAAHRVIASVVDDAISIQLHDKGLRDKAVSSRKRLERYGSAAIVAPRSFRPSEMGAFLIKGLAINPGFVFGLNGIGFRPESLREYNIQRRMLPSQIARSMSREEFGSLRDEIAEHYDEEMEDMLSDMREAEMEDRRRYGDIHIYDEEVHGVGCL
ncbi:hypothetical protein [Raoultella terrigena]|uniref:hypothetical protein n=1 Tax=Raoultella terrigena TaxID=577 RepID=UPI001F1C3939|nr:hypothetical protein [Raoultella terrigena]